MSAFLSRTRSALSTAAEKGVKDVAKTKVCSAKTGTGSRTAHVVVAALLVIAAVTAAGVPIEQFHPEYGVNQFEISLAPASPVAQDIRIELRRGTTAIAVTWPSDAAAQCAAWMRELLR